MAKIIKLFIIFFIAVSSCQVFADTTLRVPLHAAVISLDPSGVQDFSSLLVSRQINCQLIRMNGGVLMMEAAQSISYVSPLELDVKLKQGLKFSSGEEVTAADVIATFEYLRDKRSTLRNIFNWVVEFKPVGKYEFIIELKKPVPNILTVLAAPNHAIFEKKFILAVRKNPSLWRNPVTCGNYKIKENINNTVKLEPAHEGLPVVFSLLHDSELPASEVGNYDVISMEVIGHSDKLTSFDKVNVFDPFQYYFIFNTKERPWNNKDARCAVFARIDSRIPMLPYADQVRPANDFVPSGVLGYADSDQFLKNIIDKYKKYDLPKKKEFCVSFISSAVEESFRKFYLDMFKPYYPNTRQAFIDGYNNLAKRVENQHCDGTVFALKSNYLDAYEYLVTLSENGPNASGFRDVKLSKRIENSQNIDNTAARAKEYRSIIHDINDLCLVYPLFTMPYETLYIRNTFDAPGIGRAVINDYYLGQIKLKNMV